MSHAGNNMSTTKKAASRVGSGPFVRRFLSPSEHGKYWHDLAQERLAEISSLRSENSTLRAWQSGDSRKIKRLVAMLVRADSALARCGVGSGAPVRVNINSALKEA